MSDLLDFARAYVRFNIRRFVRNEAGVTAIEYGLIAALVGVVIITGVSALGTKLNSTFGQITAKLK